jgi:hypothetical protein
MGISESQLRILEGNAARARGVEPPAKRERPTYRSKTEARYAQYLYLLVSEHQILGWEYETVTLKLATDLRYTPDFLVRELDGSVSFHEVKGARKAFAERERLGRAKVKVAAALFPWRFWLVWPERNGEWALEVVR